MILLHWHGSPKEPANFTQLGSAVFSFRTAFCNASTGVLTSGIPGCHLKHKSFKAQQLLTCKKSIFGLQTKEGWVRNFRCMFGTDCCCKSVLWVMVQKRSSIISGGDFSCLCLFQSEIGYSIPLPGNVIAFSPCLSSPGMVSSWGSSLRTINMNSDCRRFGTWKKSSLPNQYIPPLGCSHGWPGWGGAEHQRCQSLSTYSVLPSSSGCGLLFSHSFQVAHIASSCFACFACVALTVWPIVFPRGWDPGWMQLWDTGLVKNYFCKFVCLHTNLSLLLKTVYHR